MAMAKNVVPVIFVIYEVTENNEELPKQLPNIDFTFGRPQNFTI